MDATEAREMLDPEVMTDIQDHGDLLALKGTVERREYLVTVASTL